MTNIKKSVSTVLLVGFVGAIILLKGRMVLAPASYVLPVPFSPQALDNNWDHNEDCEETSIVMANAYLSGNTDNILSVTMAEHDIDAVKEWEQAHLGYNADTGADASTTMAEQVFELKIEKIKDFSEHDLKIALSHKHPVLLPINSSLLESPQYRDVPAFYHMIIIRGYTDKGFIVNDPGTSEGNGNVYSFETLQKAATDWNHDAKKMEPDTKVALVVSK